MKEKTAKILLASVIVARSTSFVFSKLSLEHMGKFNLLSIRFLVAFIFLVIIFRKKIVDTNKLTILKGALLGFTFFLVVAFELESIKTTPTSTTSFLENTAIIFVPLVECVLKRRFPKFTTLTGCALALLGIGVLTLRENISLSQGEFYAILAALLYTAAIIIGDRVSKNDDSLVIGIFQVGFLALFSSLATLVFETPTLPVHSAEWINILMLAFVCTGFGFTLQPVAQRYVSSEKTGLYCSLNPAATAILGSIFLNENLGLNGIIGGSIILFSILVPSILEKLGHKINESTVSGKKLVG